MDRCSATILQKHKHHLGPRCHPAMDPVSGAITGDEMMMPTAASRQALRKQPGASQNGLVGTTGSGYRRSGLLGIGSGPEADGARLQRNFCPPFKAIRSA